MHEELGNKTRVKTCGIRDVCDTGHRKDMGERVEVSEGQSCRGGRQGGRGQTRSQILVLPATRCVTLGKALGFPEL